jgi:predicted glycogen debranching enzyme
VDLREWLETNGTGAFAMGTACGMATRRYHGLLVASRRPPTERIVALARLDETVLLDGRSVELATNQYPGAVSPEGYRYLAGFRGDPWPTWTWDIGDLRIEKQLFLPRGQQAVVVRYRANRRVRLAVAPFVAMRDYHALRRKGPVPEGLHMWSSGGPLAADGAWYENVQYAVERERGLDFEEDLWRPGHFMLDGDDAWVVASIDERPWDGARVAEAERQEHDRRRPLAGGGLRARLERAADQFLVRRHDESLTVIAGYPWFTDWGRDTMIALPGLLLARGLIDEAREVVRGFLAYLDRGLVPNLFPDRGAVPEYNTVDATLWLFQAARACGPEWAVCHAYPAGKEIIRWHERGTHGGIVVDPADGLLVGGAPGTQLTWMDARVDGRPCTPRHGKAVEINALWHGALRIMADWATAAGETAWAARYAEMAARVARAFVATFWNPARGCLYDVVREDGPDASIRPNQVIALALSHALVPDDKARSILAVVERELLTPYGLRTLAPGDAGYTPRYGGGPAQRDAAYHQGTVWPWLLGPFVRALVRVHGRTPETLARGHALLAGLERHLDEGCIGQIAEVFDAEPPHAPGGAPAQAWSVAEVLWAVAVELAGRAETVSAVA